MGAFDDALRHALTQLCHIHLVATEEYARRVRQMGAPPEHVHVVGAPGLDDLRRLAPLSDKVLEAEFGFKRGETNLLVVYHPREGLPVLSVNHIGMVGAFTGMNAKGLCFGNLLVFNAAEDETRGGNLPIQLHLRAAAHRCGDLDSFVRYLRDRKHAIPMNVMAADGKEARVVELGLSRSSVRTRRPWTST